MFLNWRITMTPFQAVSYAASIYDPIAPGIFQQVFRVGDWVVGYALDAQSNPVFAIAGSERIEDFIADADFIPVDAGQLGHVHAGFYRDARAVFDALRPLINNDATITGHSLGASRAALLAGLCAIHHLPVKNLYMFEPAAPGYEELALQVHGFVPNIVGTRNARDFVPDLPPPFPFPYTHICELIDLDHPADSIDPVQDHMLATVTAGVLKRWPPHAS
jgi:pimeloyl-ACP methyl ester carboxylesterase